MLTALWLALAVKTVRTPRKFGAFAVMTAVVAMTGGALAYNYYSGPSARLREKYERTCGDWRMRYNQAATLIELERARDGLKESLCRIH